MSRLFLLFLVATRVCHNEARPDDVAASPVPVVLWHGMGECVVVWYIYIRDALNYVRSRARDMMASDMHRRQLLLLLQPRRYQGDPRGAPARRLRQVY